MMDTKRIWIVAKRNNHCRSWQYSAHVCFSYDEAIQMMKDISDCECTLEVDKIVENGMYYDAINQFTGEVQEHYLIKLIGEL